VARLIPAPFAELLGLALEEHAATGRVFGLPRRSWRSATAGLDLSVDLPGGRAGTPVGPAAGPHTQLARNLVVAWLAGARAFELKTVQADDRIVIPRPCIASGPATLNVEWSQELRLEESAEQYVAGWLLIHALRARGLSGAPDEGVVFDASVGYDLEGIRSAPVARFLDTLADASALLRAMRAGLPRELAAAADVEVPSRVAAAVTVSTFHGCPPEQIEAIVEHLFDRHGMEVVVKFNPTLLGFDEVEWLLRGRLGRDDVALDRGAFATDLGWDAALGLIARLRRAAARRGRALGLKVSNTLVVRNARAPLPGDVVYLSGRPLLPIAATLAARLADATAGRVPIAMSGGLDAGAVADAVAAGLAPATGCTDLLQPTGYRRLPGWIAAIEAELLRTGSRTLGGLVLARARERGVAPGEAPPPSHAPALGPDAPDALRLAALVNLRAWAERVAHGPREAAPAAAPAPRPALRTLDCAACNRCALACPNGAFLRVRVPLEEGAAFDLAIEDGVVRVRPSAERPTIEDQWVVHAAACNACGACDAPCPEQGPPHAVKPRLHVDPAAWAEEAPADGVLVEDGGAALRVRIGGAVTRVARDDAGLRVEDGAIEAALDAAGRLLAARAVAVRAGHVLPLARVRAITRIVAALLAAPGPVRAALHTRAAREHAAR